MGLLAKIGNRIRKSAGFRALTQRLFAGYVGLVLRSTRWEYVGLEPIEADLARGVPRVFCAWHERLVLMPHFRTWDDHPMHALGSAHPDSRIATAFMASRGIGIIEMKTSGDKTGALKRAVRLVRAGGSLGMTPDGPFGPARMVQPGAVMIASMSRARLCAVAFSTRWRFRVKTWDRMLVPLPFGRGVFVLAEGEVPPARASAAQIAAAQNALARLLDRVGIEADRRVDG